MKIAHLLFAALLLTAGCRDRTFETRLAAAEAVMEEHPDSALRLLRAPGPSAAGTRREEARLRLLLSQAYNRTGTDLQSDSLIAPALEYFERHGTAAERARAWYYYGAVHHHAQELDRAVEGYAAALRFAEKAAPTAENRRLAAGLYHTLGGLYTDQRYTAQAEAHFIRASQIWDEIGEEENRSYSEFMRAMCQYQGMRYLEALQTLDAIPSGNPMLDPMLGIYRILLHLYLGDRTPDELLAARDSIDRRGISGTAIRHGTASVPPSEDRAIYDIVSALLFYEAGQIDSATFHVGRALDELDGFRQGTVGVLRMAASIAHKRGDPEEAYAFERRYSDAADSIHRAEQPVQIAALDRRYRTQYETVLLRTRHRYQSWIAALAGLLLAGGAGWMAAGYRRKLRRRDEQLNEYLALLDSYRESHDTLASRLDATDAREAAVKQVLEGRMASIREIAAARYTYGDGQRLATRIRELALNPATLADVVRMADLYGDRAVTRLREQLPGWTPRNYDFAALVIAGFLPQEISVLLDMSLNGVYTCKSKLKRRIAASEAPDREFFLHFFA